MRHRPLLTFICLFSLMLPVACQHKPQPFSSDNNKPLCLSEHRVPSMGTFFELQLVHDCRFDTEPLIVAAQSKLEEIESELSLYQKDSQLSRLNREGQSCPATPHLLKMAVVSKLYYDKTEGAFDVSILPVLQRIEASFDTTKTPPKDLARYRPLVDAKNIKINGDCLVLANKGMALSFDGVAKGYAVDLVAEQFPKEIQGYLLNFSGNMRWRGQKPTGPWKIAAWNPVIQSVIALEAGSGGAIASSGPEHVHFDGKSEWHHLIDAQKLRPANHYRSVTVVGESAMECDILSTSFFILEPWRAEQLRAKQFPQVSLIFVDRNGRESYLPKKQTPH